MRRVIAQEHTQMALQVPRFVKEVNELLQEEFGKELFYLTEANAHRLMTLKAWQIKHKVSLRYILKQIVPYYQHKIGRRFSMNSKSLGFRIPTLVGKKAEKLLQFRIAEDFPEKENVRSWVWEKKRSIVTNRLEDPTVPERHKTLHEYGSIKRFVKAYKIRMADKRFYFTKEDEKESNTFRPYRGNPWRM